MTITDEQLAIVFEEADLKWNKISNTLTKDTCKDEVKDISTTNFETVLWCLAKNPNDNNAKYINLLNKFISDNADVIQNNEASFKRKIEGLIHKLELPPETVNKILETSNDIVKKSKNDWNSSTKIDDYKTYKGGLGPIAIVFIVIGAVVISMVASTGGKPKRKTRKNRNRKPKKSQKKRKSRKNRKSNHNKR